MVELPGRKNIPSVLSAYPYACIGQVFLANFDEILHETSGDCYQSIGQQKSRLWGSFTVFIFLDTFG